jgi:hypothetical protein
MLVINLILKGLFEIYQNLTTYIIVWYPILKFGTHFESLPSLGKPDILNVQSFSRRDLKQTVFPPCKREGGLLISGPGLIFYP